VQRGMLTLFVLNSCWVDRTAE